MLVEKLYDENDSNNIKRDRFLDFLMGLEDGQRIVTFDEYKRIFFMEFNQKRTLDVAYGKNDYVVVGGHAIATLQNRTIPLLDETVPTIMPLRLDDPLTDGKDKYTFINYIDLRRVARNINEFNLGLKDFKIGSNDEIIRFSSIYFTNHTTL